MSALAEPAYRHVAVVGAGTVGASWAALFCAYDLDVSVYDPSPSARESALHIVANAQRQLIALGRSGTGTITFVDRMVDAVSGADWIQENVVEDLPIKTRLLAAIDAAAPKHAIIGSSTSSLLHSAITADCLRPDRVVIAHPFNPPHLIPLVEVFGSFRASMAATAFYEALGRRVVVMQREQQGHIANRLSSALYREAVSLVASGSASVAQVDDALRFGPGLRWAVMGAHMLYHLGGGPGGIRHYLTHLGPSHERRWADLGSPSLDSDVKGAIVAGVEAAAKGRDIRTLEGERDDALVAVLKALGGR